MIKYSYEIPKDKHFMELKFPYYYEISGWGNKEEITFGTEEDWGKYGKNKFTTTWNLPVKHTFKNYKVLLSVFAWEKENWEPCSCGRCWGSRLPKEKNPIFYVNKYKISRK